MVLFQHMANETTLQLRVAELLPDHVHQVSVAAVFGEGIRSAVTLWIKTSLLASMHICVEASMDNIYYLYHS